MDSRNVKTAADARALVESRGLSHVKLGVTDLDQLPTPSPTAGLTPDGPPLTPLSFRGRLTE